MFSSRGLWARFIVFSISIGCFLYGIGMGGIMSFPQPSYDHIPITPQTWQEVDLRYFDMIHGKRYPGSIQLLRPIRWLHLHDMDKVGNVVTLSIPEFGVVDVKAQVVRVKPTNIDTRGVDWAKMRSSPVIGRFKRYAPVVNTYTFMDVQGKTEHIHATPNHPFYVVNKHRFLQITNVSRNDHLINDKGQYLKLVCVSGRMKHCGVRYNLKGSAIPVYNLEIFRRHMYFIGNNNILVRNNCDIYVRYEYSNNKIAAKYFSINHNHASGIGVRNWHDLYDLEPSPVSYGYNCLQCARRLDDVLNTGNKSLTPSQPLSTISPSLLYSDDVVHFTYGGGFDLHNGLIESEVGSRFLIFAESIDGMSHVFNAVRSGNGVAYIEDFSSDGLDLIGGHSQIRIFSRDSPVFSRMNINRSGRWLSIQTGYVSNIPFI